MNKASTCWQHLLKTLITLKSHIAETANYNGSFGASPFFSHSFLGTSLDGITSTKSMLLRTEAEMGYSVGTLLPNSNFPLGVQC